VNSENETEGKMLNVRKEIVSREIAGETLLIPISGKLANLQRIYSLNPVAECIWKQLDGKKTLQEISESVLSVFEVERTQADGDIQEFVAELLKEGLITQE
jgi:hypothetical protein